MVLMLLAAFGALLSFIGAIDTVSSAGPDTQVVESWRMWGFLVFAGLFALLALHPRRYPGVWELVILHKTATATIAAALITSGASDALTVAVVDGTLTVVTIAAYFLSRGFAGWTRFRSELP